MISIRMKKIVTPSFLALCALSALGISAAAGEESALELVPIELMGTFKAGYSSLYEYRGMVAHEKSSGGMVLDGSLAYAPEVPFAPMVSFTFRDMELLNSSGQTNFFAGGQSIMESSHENVQNTFRGGYQMISGGLPGVMKSWEKNRNVESTSGTTHEVVLNYTSSYSLDKGTIFASYTGGYSFAGLTGWYLSTSAGYLYPVNDKISVAVSGNLSWSFNYWTSANGADQANVLVTFPVRVREDCVLTPYIMADWGARNAKLINRAVGQRVIDNFAVVAGVSLEFQF